MSRGKLMKKFTEIKDERQLEDLKDFSADFHDSRIVNMNCKLNYSNKKNAYNEWYTLKIRLEGVYFAESKYKPDSIVSCEGCKYDGIELVFEKIGKVFFNPNSVDYLYIYDALLIIKDGKFIFNAFNDEQEMADLDTDTLNLYVSAEKLSYRLF